MRRIYAYSFQIAKPFYNLYNAYTNKITHINDEYERYHHMVSVGNPYHSIKLVNSSRETFLRENPQLRNKQIISISPGGYKGFYIMGICKFIKQNYKLDNCVFSGASAGAWNALLLCSKHNIQDIENQLLDFSIINAKSIYEMENLIKTRLLEVYKTHDFELDKLFIGVTTFVNHMPNTTIYYGFNDLEEAIDCCIASSHIPFITGGAIHRYRNLISFDGGFCKQPYVNISNPVLHITPNIWKRYKKMSLENPHFKISDYTTLFSKDKYILSDMISDGYEDSQRNKDTLDFIFHN